MKFIFEVILPILLFTSFGDYKNPEKVNNTNDVQAVQFVCNEVLFRPTSNSISINACSNIPIDVYYEYGIDSNNYTLQTPVQRSVDSIPFSTVISGLNANTQYFYRMRYKEVSSATYLAKPNRTFRTQRPAGSSFNFVVQADPHLDTNSNPSAYTVALQNMLFQKPDFMIDLGDNFMSEKLPVYTAEDIKSRHLLLRNYYDLVCHSIPLFITLGNHEGELGWLPDSSTTSLKVLATNTRKFYYLNPEPNSFYSGNSTPSTNVGLRQNYYSWTWGNCLFVVIDPYWYTKSKPAWGWSLGLEQFNWLKNVLTTSNAKFKFIFSHQVVGGSGNEGRGGTEVAHLFEMGGRNADSTWGFDTYRPGWGGKPVHTLMVENKVNIFFHGHDHFFGKQEKDGVVYQEVPQPSSRSVTSISATQYGYLDGVFIPSRGHLSVNVTNSKVKVDYVRAYVPSEENATRHNRDVSYSYTIDTTGAIVGINEFSSVPNTITLNQNYPNPFNPSTIIKYTIAKADKVLLKVYDNMGREVKTLVNNFQQAGTYTAVFNSDDASLSSGIYYCVITTGGYSKSMKMIFVK
ncbi:MAG: metallophosphoesterase [Ignavibacteria bacterium]|nr:metallophosphoesterase [Ignavibacteria bacterium]